jgi:hypothetical protein
MTFTDEKAELRLACLQIAKDLTSNPDSAIDAAKMFEDFVNGTLEDKKE